MPDLTGQSYTPSASVGLTAAEVQALLAAQTATLGTNMANQAEIQAAVEAAITAAMPVAIITAGNQGPSATEIASAIAADNTYDGPTAASIAAAIAAEDTYDGPTVTEFEAAMLAALVAQNLSAAQIGAAVEAADTFKGLTAAQQQTAIEAALTTKQLSATAIAAAIEDEQQNAVIRILRVNFNGTAGAAYALATAYPDLIGKSGAIITVHEVGPGNVTFTTDGTSPTATTGASVTGSGLQFNRIDGVSFDNVRFSFTNNTGAVMMVVEVYP